MTDKDKLAEQYNTFCEELGLTKPIVITADTRKEAIEAWNRRAE